MKEYRLSPNGNLYTYDEFLEKIKSLDMHEYDIQLVNMIWENYQIIPVKNKRQLEKLKYIYKKPQKEYSWLEAARRMEDIMMWGSVSKFSEL